MTVNIVFKDGTHSTIHSTKVDIIEDFIQENASLFAKDFDKQIVDFQITD